MMAHVVGEADAELEGEEQQQPQQWRPTRRMQSCCSSELELKTAETARLAAAVLGQLVGRDLA